MSFKLRGLPEGIVGRSEVQARSLEDLFATYPELAAVRDRLQIDGSTVRGFMPCIG